MTYKLLFDDLALREWKKLAPPLKDHFKKKLIERCENPRVASAKLSGMNDCYKIKMAGAGYRLVYRVMDKEIQIIVIAVGKRERNYVYKNAIKRIE